MTNPHKGSSLDIFLQEEGILESVEEKSKRRAEKMTEIKFDKNIMLKMRLKSLKDSFNGEELFVKSVDELLRHIGDIEVTKFINELDTWERWYA